MGAKNYLTNTPLILQDENGEDFRVERGEVVELSPEQFVQVAAHVTPVEVADEDEQPESPAETTDKPKRGKTKDAE